METLATVVAQALRHLAPIKGGWGAYGDGWAVHGATQKEALWRFAEALQVHKKIAQQPPFYLQSEQYALFGGAIW